MNFENTIRTLFLVSLMAVAILSSAQNRTKESSNRKKYSSDSKVKDDMDGDLLDEATELRKVDPKLALFKVEEALANSITNRDVFEEAKCYLLLGDINMQIQEWKLALENYTTAYGKLKPNHSQLREYQLAMKGMGDAYLKLGNHEEALKIYTEVLDLKPGARDKAERQIDVSEAYYQMGKYQNALQTLDNIEYAKKNADPSIEIRVENQRAKVYASLNDIGRAQESYESSQKIISSVAGVPQQDLEGAGAAKEEISKTLTEQRRFDEEISLRENSIALNLKFNNLNEVTKDKVELSKALVAKGESNAAIRELEEAASMADTIGDPKKQATAYLSLAELYRAKGNDPRALNTYKKYSEAVKKSEQQNASTLLEKSELITQQRNIEAVAKYVSLAQQEEQIAQAMVSRQRLIIYGLVLILAVVGVTSYITYKNAVASKTANQLLALKSLRGQMNPHFIFNALNSMNHFVSLNDERTANKFLSEFSRLMRLVLENSQHDFIPLFKEEEIISLYLKLEHYRFRDKFDFEISIDENINKEIVHVPPMLIQPYVENAVWHGLRYRETKGFVSVRFYQQEKEVIVEIVDNGIGRQRSAELKTENQKKHNSTGLKNIRERLQIINRIYKAGYKVFIEDLPDNSGTKVKLHLTVNNKLNAYA